MFRIKIALKNLFVLKISRNRNTGSDFSQATTTCLHLLEIDVSKPTDRVSRILQQDIGQNRSIHQ